MHKSFSSFIKNSIKSIKNSSYIKSICKEYHIKRYQIRLDGNLDVYGDVNLNSKNLTKIPPIFNEVFGNFNCSRNQLTSLEGCPKIIHGGLNCSFNKLYSLVGCPESVGWIDCCHNQIFSFKGIPEKIESFVTKGNPIYDLLGLINQSSIVDFIEMINEYDVVQGKKLIYPRLIQALEDSGNKEYPFDDLLHYFSAYKSGRRKYQLVD